MRLAADGRRMGRVGDGRRACAGITRGNEEHKERHNERVHGSYPTATRKRLLAKMREAVRRISTVKLLAAALAEPAHSTRVERAFAMPSPARLLCHEAV